MDSSPLKNPNSRIRKLINTSINEAMNKCKKVYGKPNKSNILDYLVGCIKIEAETAIISKSNLQNNDIAIESILKLLKQSRATNDKNSSR